jgi:hypothetical protein
MSRLSFQLGAEIERKPSVLTWRLPKRPAPDLPTAPQHENLKKVPFGRRAAPPQEGVWH